MEHSNHVEHVSHARDLLAESFYGIVEVLHIADEALQFETVSIEILLRRTAIPTIQKMLARYMVLEWRTVTTVSVWYAEQLNHKI